MKKDKQSIKIQEDVPQIYIKDYSKRSKRVYSLQTHSKASIPIKTSRSLIKLKDIKKKKIYKKNNFRVNQITQCLTKCSNKAYNMIQSYSIGMHHGLHHNSNEDNMSIQLGSKSMFGLFDGYGGAFASSYLKKLLTNQSTLSAGINMQSNIFDIFTRLDEQILKQQIKIGDSSGTSALICWLQKQMLYIANSGSSLAFGKSTTQNLVKLNNIHNCQNQQQRARIVKSNGSFYNIKIALDDTNNFIEGPLRINHYKLTNTRTLGNPSTKDRKIIISKPEIKYIKTNNLQWICLTTSGILSILNDIQIYGIIQKQILQKTTNYHKLADRCVKKILQQALKRKCVQNMSVIVIFIGKMLPDGGKVRQNRSNTSTQASLLNLSFSRDMGRYRKKTSLG